MSIVGRIARPLAWKEGWVGPRVAEHFGLGDTAAGINLSGDAALRISTYFACVRALAEDVAKLPLHLYRRLPDGGRERVIDHPAARVIKRPNDFQTGFRWRETSQAHLGMRGNAVARVVRYRGEVRQLIPIHPDRVQIRQEPRNLEVVYRVGTDEYRRPNILHVPGLSLDGYRGVSVAKYARETLGLAAATERHGATLFGTGALFRGILRHPTKFKDDAAAKRMRQSFEEARTGHGSPLLEEGMEYQQMSMTAEDSQFLGTREFQAGEIARWFRMPPHKLGFRSGEKYNSMEHAALEYVTDTLLPWLIRWEEECNAVLLGPAERDELYFEHNVAGLLRGDLKARYEAYRIAILSGFMNRNEARKMENWNAAEGLDEFLEPTSNTRPVGETEEDE